MALKKISKHELKAIIEVTGRISYIDFKTELHDGIEEEILELRIKWSNCIIFVYERNLSMIKQLQKYKENDVVLLKGYFFARWFPGAKSSLPIIEKVIEHNRLGVLTN
ncbi:hypothetical protein [Spiroplasma endosymbiont of Atherix ibis]|uniref:hypothetical protein n=1 Tax=Spiroplasma endosymbiont of Atherix ibis TaxID=3066291 RepID=UPI0030D5235B